MQKMFRESGHFAARHELDRLSPTSAITVSLATRRQLVDLVAIARREIPGVNASEAGLAQFLCDDPESIFAFERAGNLLGGMTRKYRLSMSGRWPATGGLLSDWETSRSICESRDFSAPITSRSPRRRQAAIC